MSWLHVAVFIVVVAVALRWWFSRPPPEILFHGTTEEGWGSVADAFKKVLATNPSHGYEYAVYHKGKKVVDLYGGYADIRSLEPFRENTLAKLFSATKGLSALCVALLVDRGLLDYKKPVTHYWPEFGVNGKESITVETLLSHQAGLYTISEGYNLQDITENPDKISKQLAEQKPLWEPGTKEGYHPITIAMYMNEFVVRVDPKHRPLHQFFKEELSDPLGLDFFIGLPLSENYRTAASSPPDLSTWEDWYGLLLDNGWIFAVGTPETSKWQKVMADVKDMDIRKLGNNLYVRQIPCGSFNGYGTARDLAKLMGILANGGSYNGQSYMSPETVQLLTDVLTDKIDEVIRIPAAIGRGTVVIKSPMESSMFGTPGMGGQMVYGDPDHKLGLAFLTNKLYAGLNFNIQASPQFKSLIEATYDVLKKIQ